MRLKQANGDMGRPGIPVLRLAGSWISFFGLYLDFLLFAPWGPIFVCMCCVTIPFLSFFVDFFFLFSFQLGLLSIRCVYIYGSRTHSSCILEH